MPQQGTGQPLQSDRELAQHKLKSPGQCWVSQRVLDTVEEHLAQQVDGVEDVLHGVDPACLCEEGERGTGSRQGTRAWPGCTQNHPCYSLLSQTGHSLALGTAPHPFSSSKHLWAMPLAPRSAGRPCPAAPSLRGSQLIPPKPTMAVCPGCSPATQDTSGLQVGQQSLLQDQLRDNFPTAETPRAEAGEQPNCLQSFPAQISGTKGHVPLMDEQECQARIWIPLSLSGHQHQRAPKQPSERRWLSPPALGDPGPVLTPRGAVLGCARPAGHSHWGPCPSVTCCCGGPVESNTNTLAQS